MASDEFPRDASEEIFDAIQKEEAARSSRETAPPVPLASTGRVDAANQAAVAVGDVDVTRIHDELIKRRPITRERLDRLTDDEVRLLTDAARTDYNEYMKDPDTAVQNNKFIDRWSGHLLALDERLDNDINKHGRTWRTSRSGGNPVAGNPRPAEPAGATPPVAASEPASAPAETKPVNPQQELAATLNGMPDLKAVATKLRDAGVRGNFNVFLRALEAGTADPVLVESVQNALKEPEPTAPPPSVPSHRKLEDFIKVSPPPPPPPIERGGVIEYKPTEPIRPPGPDTPRPEAPVSGPTPPPEPGPTPEPAPVEKRGLRSPEWQAIIEKYNRMVASVNGGAVKLNPTEEGVYEGMHSKVLRQLLFSAAELSLLEKYGK